MLNFSMSILGKRCLGCSNHWGTWKFITRLIQLILKFLARLLFNVLARVSTLSSGSLIVLLISFFMLRSTFFGCHKERSHMRSSNAFNPRPLRTWEGERNVMFKEKNRGNKTKAWCLRGRLTLEIENCFTLDLKPGQMYSTFLFNVLLLTLNTIELDQLQWTRLGTQWNGIKWFWRTLNDVEDFPTKTVSVHSFICWALRFPSTFRMFISLFVWLPVRPFFCWIIRSFVHPVGHLLFLFSSIPLFVCSLVGTLQRPSICLSVGCACPLFRLSICFWILFFVVVVCYVLFVSLLVVLWLCYLSASFLFCFPFFFWGGGGRFSGMYVYFVVFPLRFYLCFFLVIAFFYY